MVVSRSFVGKGMIQKQCFLVFGFCSVAVHGAGLAEAMPGAGLGAAHAANFYLGAEWGPHLGNGALGLTGHHASSLGGVVAAHAVPGAAHAAHCVAGLAAPVGILAPMLIAGSAFNPEKRKTAAGAAEEQRRASARPHLRGGHRGQESNDSEMIMIPRQKFPRGLNVEYYSQSQQQWIRACVADHNLENRTYDLREPDGGRIRALRVPEGRIRWASSGEFPVGGLVEYDLGVRGQRMFTYVVALNDDGTYVLGTWCAGQDGTGAYELVAEPAAPRRRTYWFVQDGDEHRWVAQDDFFRYPELVCVKRAVRVGQSSQPQGTNESVRYDAGQDKTCMAPTPCSTRAPTSSAGRGSSSCSRVGSDLSSLRGRAKPASETPSGSLGELVGCLTGIGKILSQMHRTANHEGHPQHRHGE